MIRSFCDKETERLFEREAIGRLPISILRSALRKLWVFHAAQTLGDLAALPGNRLEKLAGNRRGQYSIRINAQWRVCFTWLDGGAYDVEIVDYH